MSNHHNSAAREHLGAVSASRAELDRLIAAPHSSDRSRAIDKAGSVMHLGIKLALVHAVLDVAEAIRENRRDA